MRPPRDTPPAGDRRGGATGRDRGVRTALYVTQAPGDLDLYVVEKTGRIIRVEGGAGRPVGAKPFLDLRGEVSTGSEQGLLSVAPDYARSGRFYVDFTDTEGDTRIQEFRRDPDDPDRADPATRRELLRIDQPFDNHNGGCSCSGPTS